MPRRDGTPRVFQADRILKFIQERDGQPVYIEEIVKQFNISRSSAQSVMQRMIKNVAQVNPMVTGRVWVWGAPSGAALNGGTAAASIQPAKRMFEEVGPVKDGAIIIQDTDGKLYRAVEL